ncbi:type II toxin-antitoxin system RelE/ParE family toxin [Maridesulfovibrio sp.]|uniref:type II toxin-antitoxin system RelE/ParE family toxin n=1 Tax=Maridesulfovibrio sp. TaxID=2795000 RepID=UPI0029C9EEA6|nr:type II toxin-antitoxin system RelE/ParE family toxin [Maridesulfovibrio sp.]
MNSIKWTEPAENDLFELMDYFEQKQEPDVGRMLAGKIYSSTKILIKFPQAGRQSILNGVRELVIPHIPYFIVYRISPGMVDILRVMHTSKLWTGVIK